MPKRIIAHAAFLAVVIEAGPALAIDAPKDLPPIDPIVFEFVQKHPSLVNRTLVDTASYEAASTTKGMVGQQKSVPQQSSLNEQTTLRVLRPGILEERRYQQISASVNGQRVPSNVQTTMISGAGGIIALASRITSESRLGKSTGDTKTIKIENISGTLFPLAMGNQFTLDTISRSETTAMGRVYTDMYTTKQRCRVTKQFNANSFHVGLSGAAYLVACDFQTFSKNNSSTSGQLNTVYFDALGIFIPADPIDSPEHIILTGAPTYSDQYKSVTTGSYRLKSFSFPSTLICLHPVFAEELKLRDQIDGDPSTTDWIAKAIIYLHAKYCRLTKEEPVSDGQAPIKKDCFQYTGMFRGERIFWGKCQLADSERK